MELAGLIVAVLATAAAALSLLYARGANRRADVANARAEEALDLQRRIDEREREFRDVQWAISWSPWTKQTEKPAVQLTNAGLTTATNVTLVLTLPTMQQVLNVGTVEPGETRTLDIEYPKVGPAHDHIELIRDPLWRVHWSSPLGHPDEIKGTARKPS
ncbi:hypothetical protein [Microbacterium sp. NPDC076895]|uniref:hypothetical protein n=1 Tax=Microbacterium sp. NPDC076895 TaxID=3154957 RepID=UPI003446B2A4